MLWGYRDVMDREQEMTQFAALHFVLEDGIDYISFRGTDNTIVGWRESFRLGFEVVPARKELPGIWRKRYAKTVRYVTELEDILREEI